MPLLLNEWGFSRMKGRGLTWGNQRSERLLRLD